jgi:dethiobiotin synthetase
VHLVVVTGTGTEVGKTYVSCALLRHLRLQGARVAARKPLQSFAAGDPTTDAAELAAATGEAAEAVCPPEACYEEPMAPPMAASVLGRRVPTTAELAARVTASWPDDVQVGLVEGAGGLLSPLTSDGSTLDLIGALRPRSVLLVADAGLGTINQVRLAGGALGAQPSATLVFLNRFDPRLHLHVANREWLRRDGFAVFSEVAEVAAEIGGASFAPRPTTVGPTEVE